MSAEKKFNQVFKGFRIEDNILIGDENKLRIQGRPIGEIILDSLDEQPNHVSQIDAESGAQTTNAEMKCDSIRLALWLRKQGIGKNDIISTCTHNHLDSYLPVISTLFVGATFNPWHHEITLKVARHLMQLIQPKIMFACESIIKILIEAAKLENVKITFVVFGTYLDLPSVRGLINQESREEALNFRPAKIENPLEDLAMIFFSSGTTGLPKGAMHSYKSFTTHVMSFQLAPDIVGGRNLWYSSLYWITGSLSTLQTIISSSTRIIHAEFDPEETCKVIEKYKVTWYFATPGMVTMLEKSNVLDSYKLKSLTKLYAGGSKMNKAIFEAFVKKLPHVEVYQVYGTTEFGGVIAAQNCNQKSLDSIGFVVSNTQIKIADLVSGQAVGPNEEGELCSKTKYFMLGYYKNPQATDETIDKDGWLRSGDKAFYNADGELFMVDRLKEVMKFRGHHVSPTEIEELLLTHPGVLEVAVVDVPNIFDDDHPIAFVKKDPNSEVTEEELVKLSAELGSVKKLQKGVKFLKELPRTATGKVSKGELRNMAKTYE